MANITKRTTKTGSSYLIRVFVDQNSTGKQKMKSMTWKPAPGMTEKQIQKELTRQATMFEEKVKNGEYANSQIKLEDFCQEYLKLTKPVLSPTTWRSYSRVIDSKIIPALGHMKLSSIKPLHVQRFVQMLQEPIKQDRQGRYIAGKGDNESSYLSASTVRRSFAVLQSVLGRACKLGLIPTNPAMSDKVDLPSAHTPDVEIFTPEEAEQLLECLQTEPLKYQLLIHLAIVTGCRRGELMALKWDDIDTEKQCIHIRHSNYKMKGEQVETKAPKSRTSNRVVAIPQYIVDMLKDYRSEQRKAQFEIGDKWVGQGWIFTKWDGSAMNPDTPSTWFPKFLKRNDLPPRKFHALRHTSATLLLDKGINIKAVSSRLGHAQLSTTNIYLHGLQSADQKSAELLGEMFQPKGVKNKIG